MTREEAISLLTQVNKILVNSNSWLENTHEPLNMAFDMAIEALEQEPCEDAVSRKAVLNGIDNYIEKAQSTGAKDDFISFEELVVKALPPVTPVACIAEIKFSKEDMQKLVNEKIKEIAAESNKRQWISVGERLPEKNVKVLTQDNEGIMQVDWLLVSELRWFHSQHHIVAWQPLPKPYVPDTNDGKMEETLSYADQDTMQPAT